MAVPHFELHAPSHGVPAIPLVCDSPHSGTWYPQDFGHAIARAPLRQSEDTHVDALWAGVPQVGGTLLCANFPRSYLDANRDQADIDVAMIEGTWPHAAHPSPRCLELGIGLIWRETPERLPIYTRKLSVGEVEQRIASCWRPYREALARLLDEAAQKHGGCWHLNLHSMPSNAYERLALPPRPLADVVLGDRHGTTCGPGFVDSVAQAFRARGYSVAVNDPYEGADLVRISGAPGRNRHSLQIEINRAIYMDEKTREPGPGFAALKDDIGQVLRDVSAFVQHNAAALAKTEGAVAPAG
ncbi:MAG: N-formylglutamate amidohydrolase [Burkholderiales bacterium]|nr:N-formylglutamate amidohydrolase [Burkholderiales bacterium]